MCAHLAESSLCVHVDSKSSAVQSLATNDRQWVLVTLCASATLDLADGIQALVVVNELEEVLADPGGRAARHGAAVHHLEFADVIVSLVPVGVVCRNDATETTFRGQCQHSCSDAAPSLP